MLIKDRISAGGGGEEDGFEVSIHQEHRDRSSENGKGKEEKEGGDQDGPYKQGECVEGKSKRAHVEDRNDKVDRSQNGGHSREVKAEDSKINGRTGVRGDTAERRIDCSSGSRTHFDEGGEDEERERRRK